MTFDQPTFPSKVLLHNLWHLETGECEVGWQSVMELLMTEAEVDVDYSPKGYLGLPIRKEEWNDQSNSALNVPAPLQSLLFIFQGGDGARENTGFTLCCMLQASPLLLTNGISNPM